MLLMALAPNSPAIHLSSRLAGVAYLFSVRRPVRYLWMTLDSKVW